MLSRPASGASAHTYVLLTSVGQPHAVHTGPPLASLELSSSGRDIVSPTRHTAPDVRFLGLAISLSTGAPSTMGLLDNYHDAAILHLLDSRFAPPAALPSLCQHHRSSCE